MRVSRVRAAGRQAGRQQANRGSAKNPCMQLHMSHKLLFDAQMAFNTWVLDGQESELRPGKRGPARSHIGNDDTALSTGSKKKWAIILIPAQICVVIL